MHDVDVAWFAGIFEGEGCFSIERNGNVKLTIGMTDPDIIARIKMLFPKCHNVQPIQPRPARAGYGTPKVRYTWRVGDPVEVRRITEMILPWLGERRSAKARAVLEHLANRPGGGSYQRNKTHCAQRARVLAGEHCPRAGRPRLLSAVPDLSSGLECGFHR